MSYLCLWSLFATFRAMYNKGTPDRSTALTSVHCTEKHGALEDRRARRKNGFGEEGFFS